MTRRSKKEVADIVARKLLNKPVPAPLRAVVEYAGLDAHLALVRVPHSDFLEVFGTKGRGRATPARAILECGHTTDIGLDNSYYPYRDRMRCYDCLHQRPPHIPIP